MCLRHARTIFGIYERRLAVSTVGHSWAKKTKKGETADNRIINQRTRGWMGKINEQSARQRQALRRRRHNNTSLKANRVRMCLELMEGTIWHSSGRSWPYKQWNHADHDKSCANLHIRPGPQSPVYNHTTGSTILWPCLPINHALRFQEWWGVSMQVQYTIGRVGRAAKIPEDENF